MTATLDGATKGKREPTAEERAAEELVRWAGEQGLSLASPDGLLRQLTKTVRETALKRRCEHLGHNKHCPAASDCRRSRTDGSRRLSASCARSSTCSRSPPAPPCHSSAALPPGPGPRRTRGPSPCSGEHVGLHQLSHLAGRTCAKSRCTSSPIHRRRTLSILFPSRRPRHLIGSGRARTTPADPRTAQPGRSQGRPPTGPGS